MSLLKQPQQSYIKRNLSNKKKGKVKQRPAAVEQHQAKCSAGNPFYK